MKIIFTITSSWCPAQEAGTKRPKYVPGLCTPLNEDSGLADTLRSLRQLPARDLEVAVIAIASDPSIEEAVEKKLRGIIRSARFKCPVHLVTRNVLGRFKARFEQVGFGRYRRFANTSSLPRQRNFALLLGHLLDADATVILDEGCVVEDKSFLKKIEATIHATGPAPPLGAIGIYGMQPDGGRLFHESLGWRDTGWPKDKLINQALHKVGKADRHADTPFIFGGKMAIMRSLAEDACFDPFIEYGTDLDFLLGARLHGYRFILDRLLTVKVPLPPERDRWRRYRQDIWRFVHMRYKLTHQAKLASKGKKLSLGDFNPYPGAFMRFSLYPRAVLVNVCCFLVNLVRLRLKAWHYLVNAFYIPPRARYGQRKRFKSYLGVLEDWRSFVRVVREDREALRKILLSDN